MAEGSSQEKSFSPTAKRLQKARDAGQIAFSREASGAAVFLSGIFLIHFSLGPFVTQWHLLFAASCRAMELGGTQEIDLRGVSLGVLRLGLTTLVPALIGAALMGLAASFAQTGFAFSWSPVMPSLERIDPFKGVGRLFSSTSGAELIRILMKATLLGALLYRPLRNAAFTFTLTAPGEAGPLFQTMCEAAMSLATTIGIWIALLAAVDYGWQRWHLRQSLMMSRQEVHDEARETDGNPKMKARIRQMMKRWSGRRMMKKVPLATVIVTNPTHLAVALQFVPPMRAPIVVAKGADRLALKIKAIALEHGVPLVENVSLARVLYRRVDVDQELPAFLYQAVAEVLAYVYRLRRKA